MKTKKILLSSILTLALCLSLICGATFALFTSTSTANIAVSSGKVNMTAEIENVKLSYQKPNTDNTAYETVEGELFAGNATVEGNKISLEKLVPGDKITLDIVVYNESNVASKYQTLVGISSDNGLFDGLAVTLDNVTYTGATAKSEWIDAVAVAEKTKIQTVAVSIGLPIDAGNGYQDKSCELYLTVNAVQGNALCTNPVENTVELYTARDLLMFAEEVNSGTNYKDWTIVMMNDIDMAGVTMAPIGTLAGGRDFDGTFDGSGKTLKNLTIVGTDVHGTGLFGSNDEYNGQTVVKNLTIDGANISGPKNVGAFIGMSYAGKVENCCVKNSTIIATGEKRASTLVANAVSKVSITNCQAIDCTVVARENAAELFANIREDSTNKNNTATRVNVITATAITTAEDLVAFAKDVNENGNSYAGKTVMLMNDIDLNNVAWTPIGQAGGDSAKTYFQGTFDGNGKTISNLTIGESSWEKGSNDGQNFATGFFGFIDMGSTTIKNVTFDKANVEGHHWVGVVAGYMTGTVSDVTVTNSTVTSSYKTSAADGDKAGGIVGYLNQGSITGCTVSDSTVTAVRDNGSVVGYSTASGSVTGNTAENCTVYYSTDNSAQIGGEIAGKRAQGVSDNTANNVTVILNTSVSTAEQLAAALTADADKIEVVLANDIELDISSLGTQIPGSGQYRLGGADTQEIEIDLNGKNFKLTSTYMLALGATNSEATITVKNGTMSSYTSFAQTWNMYDIMFTDCDWVLDGVTFENAVAINNAGSTVTMNNVTINEVNDLYAIWICSGADVTMDRCTVNSAGRAIKISDQYVAKVERRLTKLTVKNTTFKSVKKAAILVGSTAGANITLDNVDISGVTEDSTNAVWVDNGTQTETGESYADCAGDVTVKDGSKIIEP